MNDVSIVGTSLIFEISGELDDHVAGMLRSRIDDILLRRDIKNIIFDFSNLTMMDSSGIGLIIGRYKLIKERGGEVLLVIADSPAKKILKMSGLLKIFKAYDSLENAVTVAESRIYG